MKVIIGDLFESEAHTLVNTVNCVGIMGKGVALGFKKRFPDMYQDYLARCNAGQVELGKPYLYRRLVPPWILNFPTKDHWRSVARIQDIVNGLEHLACHYKQWGIKSLAVPPLGSGEGQLEWAVVGPTLYRYLSKLSIPVELYAPFGTPPRQLEIDFLSQAAESAFIGASQGRIKPDWISLVEILNRIKHEPYHWPVGRVTFQKLAYFATEAGLETDLTFTRGSFGPYESNLKNVMTKLVNNGLLREERSGQMFHITTGQTFQDASNTYQSTIMKAEPTINRVADLFLRMTPRQAEIAATVHFAAKTLVQESDRIPSEKEVFAYVLDWKQRRKPPFKDTEIAVTIRILAALNWIKVTASADLPVADDLLLEV